MNRPRQRAATALVAGCLLLGGFESWANAVEPPAPPKKVAAIATLYRHNSHADLLIGRLLQTDTLDGNGASRSLRLASLTIDQTPKGDVGRALAAQHHVPVYETIDQTLICGTGRLAVDGVLLVAEHGEYPFSEVGQTIYPKRRMFEQVVKRLRADGRAVPVFIDKQLADNSTDAKWIYDTARELKIPLLAGSVLPLCWREPALDVERDRAIDQIVVVSYHTLDAYAFHALEAMQALVERRRGGETGVAAVRCLSDQKVWAAVRDGVVPRQLLEAAIGRLTSPQGGNRPLEEVVPHPELFTVEYVDGLRGHVLTLNGKAGEWTAAWRYKDDPQPRAILLRTQEARPFMHFAYQIQAIEQLMQTLKAPWPVERTLLTSSLLHELMVSKHQGGVRIETPLLKISYQSEWNWRQPPPAPPDRPLDGP